MPLPAPDGEEKPEVVPEVIPAAEATTADSDVLDIIDEEIPIITINQPILVHAAAPDQESESEEEKETVEEVKQEEEKTKEEKTEEEKTEEVEKTEVEETDFTQSILSEVEQRISESENAEVVQEKSQVEQIAKEGNFYQKDVKKLILNKKIGKLIKNQI